MSSLLDDLLMGAGADGCPLWLEDDLGLRLSPGRGMCGGEGFGSVVYCASGSAARAHGAASEADWRCLDATHGVECARCTQPAASDSDLVLTTGGVAAGASGDDAAAKSGFKALRAGVLQTAEWNSSSARAAAAAALQAGGDSVTLAAALRRKAGRVLSKAHLLTLCRLWRYRSDAWCAPGALPRATAAAQPNRRSGTVERLTAAARAPPPHRRQLRGTVRRRNTRHAAPSGGDATAGRRPTDTAAPVAVPRTLALLPAPSDGCEVLLVVSEQLQPLLARCAAELEGPRTRQEVLQTRTALFNASSVRNYRIMQGVAAAVHARIAALVAAQKTFAVEVTLAAAAASPRAGDGGGDPPPAWRMLALQAASATAPVDAALTTVRQSFGCALPFLAGLRAHWLANGPPGAPAPVIIVELETAVDDALWYGTRACALLASLAERAPLAAYLGAAEQVIEDMAAATRAVERAFESRALWAEEAIAGGVVTQSVSYSDSVSAMQFFSPIMALAAPQGA